MDDLPDEADGHQRPRKKITIASRQNQALRALANNENGAEWRIFEELSIAVLSGKNIEPDFQTVVNAIVAKTFLLEKLPPKQKGRPKDEGSIHGWTVAQRYYSYKDAGLTYQDSVTKVAQEFCKDERHIMRLVRENKDKIGTTVEARAQTRAWWAMCAEVEREARANGKKTYLDRMTEIFSAQEPRDPLADLEAIIELGISNIKTDTN